MSKEKKVEIKDKDSYYMNPYIQYGTFLYSYIGTLIATHVYDYLKEKEPKESTKAEA